MRLVELTRLSGAKMFINPEHVTAVRASIEAGATEMWILGIECPHDFLGAPDEIVRLLEGRPPPGERPPPTSIPRCAAVSRGNWQCELTWGHEGLHRNDMSPATEWA